MKKSIGQQKRKLRVRKKIFGTDNKPRLSIFRSNRYIYAQIINDKDGKTLAAASGFRSNERGLKMAAWVGEQIAKKAKKVKVKKVIFDRGGYKYHGKIKALAEAARKAGLEF